MKNENMIRALTHNSFIELMNKLGEKRFQSDVIKKFLYRIGAADFNEITTLSKEKRNILIESHTAKLPSIIKNERSSDGTIKLLLDWNNTLSETVLISSKGIKTICISVQSGCKLNCSFCATGRLGFRNNLSFGQILDQFLIASSETSIDKIVVMGMGEPMDNLDELIPALRFFLSPQGWGLSRKKITVSTVGICPGIDRLAKAKLGVELAISLHSTKNTIREALIPINKKYRIEDILESGKNYSVIANAKVTIEYLLLKEINDTDEDASALGRISRKYEMPVNIIQYNPVAEVIYEPSNRLDEFVRLVKEKAIAVTVRRSKGSDINAACGQLAVK